jgi:hypothetical protein
MEELNSSEGSVTLNHSTNVDELLNEENPMKFTHLSQLIFRATSINFFDLMICLYRHLEVSDFDEKMLVFKLFSLPASNHDYVSMSRLIELFP